MFLLDEFEKYIVENELFSHDDKLLLTVSGGVDSMVMMSLIAATGYRFGVAHCNFQFYCLKCKLCIRDSLFFGDLILVLPVVVDVGDVIVVLELLKQKLHFLFILVGRKLSVRVRDH